MASVNDILLQVPAPEPASGPKITKAMYVGGAGAAFFVALMVLSPSCVMSDTEDGLTTFSVGKALLFSLLVTVAAYYVIN